MSEVIFDCFEVKEAFSKKRGLEVDWEKIGTMYLHKDGKGFTQYLTKLPRNKRVVCRPPLQKQTAIAPPVQEQQILKPPPMTNTAGERYSILNVKQ